MRKLISIGVVLALLVTFMVPIAVWAQECDEPPCPYTPPEGGPLPAKTTKTLAGAAMWTLLSVSDIMGRAVCATTGQMTANLGGWSDELGIVMVDVTGAALDGLASLVEAIMDMIGMEDMGAAIAEMLRGIADAILGVAAA